MGGEAKIMPLPSRRPEPYQAEDDRQVVGFGDHPPAFLARPRVKMA